MAGKEKILDDWKAEFYDDSAKVSELIRTLALAGIAIIWIFNKTSPNKDIVINLPSQLILPLTLFVIGLGVDVFQYIWRSVTIYIFYRKQEIKYEKNSASFTEKTKLPRYIAYGTWIFFVLKIVFIAWGYCSILSFLATSFKS